MNNLLVERRPLGVGRVADDGKSTTRIINFLFRSAIITWCYFMFFCDSFASMALFPWSDPRDKFYAKMSGFGCSFDDSPALPCRLVLLRSARCLIDANILCGKAIIHSCLRLFLFPSYSCWGILWTKWSHFLFEVRAGLWKIWLEYNGSPTSSMNRFMKISLNFSSGITR